MALGVVHGVAWFIVAGRIEAGVQGFAAVASTYGWTVEAPAGIRTGWPLAAAIRLPEVVALRPLGATQVRCRFTDVVVSVGLGSPRSVRIRFQGPASVAFGTAAPVALLADEAVLSVPLAGDAPVGFIAAGLRVDRVRAGTIAVQATPLALTLTADGVVTDPPLAAPFAGAAQLHLRAVTSLPFPARDSPAQSAAAWQAASGTVAVPEFALDWGELHAEGSATGSLDRQLQPQATGSVRMRGATAVLDAGAQAGLVAPGPASAIRAVLQLMTLGAGGGPITLPVALRDRVLTVGSFPVSRLPPLSWGD